MVGFETTDFDKKVLVFKDEGHKQTRPITPMLGIYTRSVAKSNIIYYSLKSLKEIIKKKKIIQNRVGWTLFLRNIHVYVYFKSLKTSPSCCFIPCFISIRFAIATHIFSVTYHLPHRRHVSIQNSSH